MLLWYGIFVSRVGVGGGVNVAGGRGVEGISFRATDSSAYIPCAMGHMVPELPVLKCTQQQLGRDGSP